MNSFATTKLVPLTFEVASAHLDRASLECYLIEALYFSHSKSSNENIHTEFNSQEQLAITERLSLVIR